MCPVTFESPEPRPGHPGARPGDACRASLRSQISVSHIHCSRHGNRPRGRRGRAAVVIATARAPQPRSHERGQVGLFRFSSFFFPTENTPRLCEALSAPHAAFRAPQHHVDSPAERGFAEVRPQEVLGDTSLEKQLVPTVRSRLRPLPPPRPASPPQLPSGRPWRFGRQARGQLTFCFCPHVSLVPCLSRGPGSAVPSVPGAHNLCAQQLGVFLIVPRVELRARNPFP